MDENTNVLKNIEKRVIDKKPSGKTNESSISSVFNVAKEKVPDPKQGYKIHSKINSNTLMPGLIAETNSFNHTGEISESHEDLDIKQIENLQVLENDNNLNENNGNKNDISQSNTWKDDIRSSCMNIFLNFAKFNNEDKDFYLSHQNLCKILRTISLLDLNPNARSYIKMADIDVILKKVNPWGQKVNSRQFMNFIVQLSNRLDPLNFSKDQKR